MCVVSDKLTLCTCYAKDIAAMPHTWVFYRRIKDKYEMLVGLSMIPYSLDPAQDARNYDLLLTLLNAGNPFDVDLHIKNGDRICLSFTCWGQDAKTNFGFAYNGTQWSKCEYDYFDWNGSLDEIAFGKINDALAH